jgi:hypothetical protein
MSIQTFILTSELDLPVTLRFATIFNTPQFPERSSSPKKPLQPEKQSSQPDIKSSSQKSPESPFPLKPLPQQNQIYSSWDLDKSIDFYFSVEIFSGGISLTSTPTFSSLYTTNSASDPFPLNNFNHLDNQQQSQNRVEIDEWLTLPILYKDLPPNALFIINIWGININLQQTFSQTSNRPQEMKRQLNDFSEPFHFSQKQFLTCLGGTTFQIFNKSGRMKHGLRRLYITPHVEASGQNPEMTPYKKPSTIQSQNYDNI